MHLTLSVCNSISQISRSLEYLSDLTLSYMWGSATPLNLTDFLDLILNINI